MCRKNEKDFEGRMAVLHLSVLASMGEETLRCKKADVKVATNVKINV